MVDINLQQMWKQFEKMLEKTVELTVNWSDLHVYYSSSDMDVGF